MGPVTNLSENRRSNGGAMAIADAPPPVTEAARANATKPQAYNARGYDFVAFDVQDGLPHSEGPAPLRPNTAGNPSKEPRWLQE